MVVIFLGDLIDQSALLRPCHLSNAQVCCSTLPARPPQSQIHVSSAAHQLASRLLPNRHHRNRRLSALLRKTSLPIPVSPLCVVASNLIAVSKKDIQTGKSGSFDGTDEEWQQIVLDALFSSSAQQDIALSASLNKAKDKITVLLYKGWCLTAGYCAESG